MSTMETCSHWHCLCPTSVPLSPPTMYTKRFKHGNSAGVQRRESKTHLLHREGAEGKEQVHEELVVQSLVQQLSIPLGYSATS